VEAQLMHKMKRVIILLFAVVCVFLLMGCGADDYDPPVETLAYDQDEQQEAGITIDNNYDDAETNYYVFVSTIPLDLAEELFTRMHVAWDEDDGDLWGFHLFAPSMIADPISRHVVANMPDPEGHFTRHGDLYVGILPDDVFVSHTAVEFAGLTWGMLMWSPMESGIYESGDFESFGLDGRDEFVTMLLRVFIHEGFHAVQLQVLPGHDTISPLADQMSPHAERCADARISILLEMNALRQALSTEGDERHRAIHDAISIRAHRRHGQPEIYLSENMQELNEGIAVFTDIYLVHGNADVLLAEYDDNMMRVLVESSGLGSGFPYFTGAAYAFLLRDTGVSWQYNLTWDTDLAALLQEAVGITELIPFDEIDLERYGYSQLAPDARVFVERFQRIYQGAREFVELPNNILIEGIWTFGGIFENELVDVEIDHNRGYLVFYDRIDFVASNWRIEMLSGYSHMVTHPAQGIAIPFYENIAISEDGTRATSPTWELEILDPAYQIVMDEQGSISVVLR